MVRLDRFELPTFWFVVRRYIVRRCSRRSVSFDLHQASVRFMPDRTRISALVAVTVAVKVPSRKDLKSIEPKQAIRLVTAATALVVVAAAGDFRPALAGP